MFLKRIKRPHPKSPNKQTQYEEEKKTFTSEHKIPTTHMTNQLFPDGILNLI